LVRISRWAGDEGYGKETLEALKYMYADAALVGDMITQSASTAGSSLHTHLRKSAVVKSKGVVGNDENNVNVTDHIAIRDRS
jgi:hypothetical protein